MDTATHVRRRRRTPLSEIKPGPSRGHRRCFEIYVGADELAREKLIARLAEEHPRAKDPRAAACMNLKQWGRGESTPMSYKLRKACYEGAGIPMDWWDQPAKEGES